jgi:hypothetical protein
VAAESFNIFPGVNAGDFLSGSRVHEPLRRSLHGQMRLCRRHMMFFAALTSAGSRCPHATQ